MAALLLLASYEFVIVYLKHDPLGEGGGLGTGGRFYPLPNSRMGGRSESVEAAIESSKRALFNDFFFQF